MKFLEKYPDDLRVVVNGYEDGYDDIFLRLSNEIVKAFERLVFPLDQTIENNENESRTLAQTRDTLLPKLLSGEIRLDDANEILEVSDGEKS